MSASGSFTYTKKGSLITIRTSTLAAEIRLRGGKNIIPQENCFIHTTLTYFARELGTKPTITRRPLTVTELNAILEISNLTNHNTTLAYCTMLAVGVYCLLRIGELCFTRSRGKKNTSNKDVVFKKTVELNSLSRTQRLSERMLVSPKQANIKLLLQPLQPRLGSESLQIRKLTRQRPLFRHSIKQTCLDSHASRFSHNKDETN